MDQGQIRSIAMLGNHVPRQCGIATFTADLARSVAGASPNVSLDVLALDEGDCDSYEPPVKYKIEAERLEDYRDAAAFLNRGQYEVLNVQHEFGIYGGSAGEHLLTLLRNVNMPIVTTLHTILREPTEDQRRVFEEVLQLSERVITMTRKGAEILQETYMIPESRIEVIPHGIHRVDPELGIELRKGHGIENRPLILTFGLLSPDKGVHHMVEAMATIAQRHPDAVYAIVGATHPKIRAHSGEAYRESLEKRVAEHGIEENVLFVNRFVTPDELSGWLAAADVYVTPYLKEEQIVSGTLAYAVGAGNAVVSTPFWHARELLEGGRGLLVPFGDAETLAKAVGTLLDDQGLRDKLGLKAYDLGQTMTWPSVGEAYLRTFEKVREESAAHLRRISHFDTQAQDPLPPVSLHHFASMTDNVGIFQHATLRFHNRTEGYCTDDCARALSLSLLADRFIPNEALRWMRDVYFTFVMHAFDHDALRFRNFLSYDRVWLDAGSDDCQGRAFRSLVAASFCKVDREIESVARELVRQSMQSMPAMTSPRAWASVALGCAEFLSHQEDPSIRRLLGDMANRLDQLLKYYRRAGWNWFEDIVAYENALMPHALIVAGNVLDDAGMLDDGLSSLAWLMDIQTAPNGVFAPIGSDGFFVRGQERAWYDQQPLEAGASVSACLAAMKVTGRQFWLNEATRAFLWFLGENTERIPMVHVETGRCFDGLQKGHANRNSGAESTITYLIARLELEEARIAAGVATNQ